MPPSSIKCPTGKIINPKTGRCVNRTGKIGQEILNSKAGKAEKKSSTKKKTPSSKKQKTDKTQSKKKPATPKPKPPSKKKLAKEKKPKNSTSKKKPTKHHHKKTSQKQKNPKYVSEEIAYKHAIQVMSESNKVKNVQQAISLIKTAASQFRKSVECNGRVHLDYAKWFEFIQTHSNLGSICAFLKKGYIIVKVVDDNNKFVTFCTWSGYFHNNDDVLVQQLLECERSGSKVVVIPISLITITDKKFETSTWQERFENSKIYRNPHANMLIINTELKEMEWFEPHGFSNEYINTVKMCNFLTSVPTLSKYKLIEPDVTCPALQGVGKDPTLTMDHCVNGGYCVVYSVLYAHLKILVPHATTKEITTALDKLPLVDMQTLLTKYARLQEVVLF